MNGTIGQLGFYLDARFCSGCKACQVACKDQNGLEVGRLWRRVYEISGGQWLRSGDAWLPDVFAYNLSISCNHCEAPICAEICPSGALARRKDGLVLLDSSRCIGCGYCKWACPYGALQYDETNGHMTKCDFCVDEIDAGRPPACVAACPLRVLDFGELSHLRSRAGHANGCFPLPDPTLTSPSLLVIPHKDALRKPEISAKITPSKELGLKERPLIAFTLLAQSAVGALLILGILRPILTHIGSIELADRLTDVVLPACDLLIIAALLISLFHLGKPIRAYRALANLRRSWLSREIGLAASFAAAGVASATLSWIDLAANPIRTVLIWTMILIGVALVFSMSRVYMLRTVPVWNSLFTPFSFFSSSLLLGLTVISALIISTRGYLGDSGRLVISNLTSLGPALSIGLVISSGLVFLVRRWSTSNHMRRTADGVEGAKRGSTLSSLRWTCLILGVALMMIALLLGSTPGTFEQPQFIPMAFSALVLVFGSEVLGRHRYFTAYARSGI